ncbi:hypothetical protein C6P74_23975 [Burkholderia multivorans]|nr:hypothetical protein C6P74_23975 [Burkholderia multivorans]
MIVYEGIEGKMNEELYVSTYKGDHERTLGILRNKENASVADIQDALSLAILKNHLNIVSSVVESNILDFRDYRLSIMLLDSCTLGHYDIATYLMDLPTFGEHDLNIVIDNKSETAHNPFMRKIHEKLAQLNSTRQKELWHAAHEGDLPLVKEIVETKNYFDLYPSLNTAGSKDRIEIVAFLFERSDLRHEQLRRLLATSGAGTKLWIQNCLLRQNLTSTLEEKEKCSRQKI